MKKLMKTSKSRSSHGISNMAKSVKKAVRNMLKKTVKKSAKKAVKKTAKKPVKKILKPAKHIPVKHLPVKHVPAKYTPVKPVPINIAQIKTAPIKESVKAMLANFKIGEYAVYPAHGVGKIEALETKTIMGEKMDFLVINIIDTGMNVLLPVNNINSVGLRQVIKPGKVKEVYDVLKEKKRSVIGATWNRRYREYMEKIKSGSIFEIAIVLRDLVVLKREKDLSFGERKMMDTAKTLLIKELALAKGIAEKKIEIEMQKIFSKL